MTLREMRDKDKPKGIELSYAPYIITEDGKVWSIRKQMYLKPHDHGLGYLYVLITHHDNKIKKQSSIHRLVAQCYIPNPDNKSDVNHKDGVKSNNHKDNLEWMTHKENIQHSFDVLKRKVYSGIDHWSYGKTIPDSSKALMSKAKIGENHPKFKGYYSLNGITCASLNGLAELIGTYGVKAHRMYKAGLIQFIPKQLNVVN